MTRPLVLAIDQGTTSSRALVFDGELGVVAQAQQEFPQHYPREGWVEHDPEAIWSSTLNVARQALRAAERDGGEVVALGITNQRETAILWDRRTGDPIANAIVWLDRRTAPACRRLGEAGHGALVQARTGLLLDPYFSATKITWLLDHVPGARERAEGGELAFGTVDSFLLWRLTGGAVHATDVTNASRTSLFDIERQRWDADLLALFDVPAAILPEVRECAADFGTTQPDLLGRRIPIYGIAGDQQAAALGQCCFGPGTIKSTYGTGCFVLMNTGRQRVHSSQRLLATIAYRLGGTTSYALEGSIFVAGAAVQWLRDRLGFVRSAGETEAIARRLDDNHGVYLVPAFSGLGAPHWDPEARGALLGMTLATGPDEIVRATLESVCYQTADLFAAMAAEAPSPAILRVDGGMVVNDWLMQHLADVLDLTIDRPAIMETTALGAAYLAGRRAGVFGNFADFAARWRIERRFEPTMHAAQRKRLLAGWRDAVRRVASSRPRDH